MKYASIHLPLSISLFLSLSVCAQRNEFYENRKAITCE